MQPIRLPRQLNKPKQFLFWTIDEMVPFSLFFLAGIASGHFFKCLILGVISTVFFRRYRDSKPDGFLLHALYWYGFMPLGGKRVLNPFHRRVLPE
jgi:conjugal transfer pilus assembly protein TraL